MVTPLKPDGTLDVEGTERLVEHILAGGVHGLFLLGMSGEAPDLSYDVRRELIERVCRQVNGRVPVLVGITDTIFSESLKIADFAKANGAAALVAAPPLRTVTIFAQPSNHFHFVVSMVDVKVRK